MPKPRVLGVAHGKVAVRTDANVVSTFQEDLGTLQPAACGNLWMMAVADARLEYGEDRDIQVEIPGVGQFATKATCRPGDIGLGVGLEVLGLPQPALSRGPESVDALARIEWLNDYILVPGSSATASLTFQRLANAGWERHRLRVMAVSISGNCLRLAVHGPKGAHPSLPLTGGIVAVLAQAQPSLGLGPPSSCFLLEDGRVEPAPRVVFRQDGRVDIGLPPTEVTLGRNISAETQAHPGPPPPILISASEPAATHARGGV